MIISETLNKDKVGYNDSCRKKTEKVFCAILLNDYWSVVVGPS